MKIKSEVLSAVDAGYTATNLKSGFWPYIQKIFNQSDFQIADGKIQAIFEKKTKSKGDLVTLVALIFSNEKLFKYFLSIIPEEARELMKVMVWDQGYYHEKMIRREFGIEIIERRTGSGWSSDSQIKSEFNLFNHQRVYDWDSGYQYMIGLHPDVRSVINVYFEKPEGYYLSAAKELPENLQFFNAEEFIFQELPRLIVYARQGEIKTSTNGYPLASTFNKMRKTLALTEFYDNLPKPYDTLRTSFLAIILSEKINLVASQDGLKTLKEVVAFYVNRFYQLHFLQHLKGLGHIDNGKKQRLGDRLIGILKEFPDEDGWVSMQQIVKFSRFRSINLKPADDYYIGRYLYYPSTENGYTEKKYITVNNYQNLIHEPLLYSSFLFFAAIGLVEAAFEEPDWEPADDGYLNQFSSLSYVRLTRLGAYFIGRIKEYTPPTMAAKANIQLLDDSLNILSDKPSDTVDVLLNNYTEKIGPIRYKTDFGVFMKGVRNASELEAKINMFRQTVAVELPKNWQEFFNTLRMKCDPLKSIGAHFAFQLSKDDQELINLIAKDPILKTLATKAEGLIILVMKNDISKFKNRLKEFGYLLE